MFKKYDNRNSPIWREAPSTITMANGGTTEGTTTIGINGVIGTIVLSLPDSTNGVTCTIAVRDFDGYELYSAAAKADDTDHVLTSVDILVAGTITIGLTASGDPGADWIGTVVLYGV